MSHACIGVPNDVYSYPTAEHAIMHIKACLMGADEMSDKELSADKPVQAKTLGRKVKPFDADKWNLNVENIAYFVLEAKFKQNDVLARKLRDTKNKVLAEASPRDRIWGIGLGAAKAKQWTRWNGRNILVNALMKVREQLIALSMS